MIKEGKHYFKGIVLRDKGLNTGSPSKDTYFLRKKSYYQRNSERLKAYQMEYYYKNRDRVREVWRNYYYRHKAKKKFTNLSK